jgi:hypothetical protein
MRGTELFLLCSHLAWKGFESSRVKIVHARPCIFESTLFITRSYYHNESAAFLPHELNAKLT